MSLRRLTLPDPVMGSLWLSSMPGRFESWSSFESEARRAALALVVCLTPRSEIRELSPAYDRVISTGGMSYEWMHMPIPNYGLPEDAAAFREGVLRIAGALRAGDAVMLHCAAGIGRTGSTAACVLKSLGLSTQEALQRVRACGSNPENAAQAGFVDWF